MCLPAAIPFPIIGLEATLPLPIDKIGGYLQLLSLLSQTRDSICFQISFMPDTKTALKKVLLGRVN